MHLESVARDTHAARADAGAPFSAIDNVSSHIFDRMEAIEHPSGGQQVWTEVEVASPMHDGSARRADNKASVLQMRAREQWSDDTHDAHGMTARERPDASGVVPLAAAAVAEADQRKRPNPEKLDITYRAAQRRSQLPDGAEPIAGAPASINEASMLASIRALMVEQKRDFNKNAFPELEPISPQAAVPSASSGNRVEQVEEFEDIEDSRLKTALAKFVRKDTVLAICLSVWVSLFLMIFIDPELSQALAIISLILLAIFRIMQPSKKKRRVVRIVNRKRNANDRALEDAILCQEA